MCFPLDNALRTHDLLGLLFFFFDRASMCFPLHNALWTHDLLGLRGRRQPTGVLYLNPEP
jgi:hypothetical protein